MITFDFCDDRLDSFQNITDKSFFKNLQEKKLCWQHHYDMSSTVYLGEKTLHL